MPIVWHSKVKFVSVSQLLGLAFCSLYGSVSGPFTTPGLIVSLGGRKIEKGKQQISLLLTLNPLSKFCWSSWMPQEEEGCASLFSLPVVLQGWGRSGSQYSQLPSLQPRSSMSCPTVHLHKARAFNPPVVRGSLQCTSSFLFKSPL